MNRSTPSVLFFLWLIPLGVATVDHTFPFPHVFHILPHQSNRLHIPPHAIHTYPPSGLPLFLPGSYILFFCNSPEEGGLNMIDLQSKLRSLKLSWIPKYLKYNNHPWMYPFHFWVNKIGPLPLCSPFNCSKKICQFYKKEQMPSFYTDLMCF